MRLTWRDGLATVFVLIAAILYLSWLAWGAVFGISSASVLGGVVLGLGLAASVTAVVYGVGAGLLRASKVYLAFASVFGLAALVAGVIVLVSEDETMLGALVIATVVLWAMATVRHMRSSETRAEGAEPRVPLKHAA